MLDVDHTGFPNIALGKISRYHKSKGDTVEWYNPLFEYDKVYLSKIFTFTPDYGYYINSRENKRVRIVAQPYRDFNNNHQIIPQWQKDMSRWAMRREIYFTCDFKDYEPRKGFLCSKYFQ